MSAQRDVPPEWLEHRGIGARTIHHHALCPANDHAARDHVEDWPIRPTRGPGDAWTYTCPNPACKARAIIGDDGRRRPDPVDDYRQATWQAERAALVMPKRIGLTRDRVVEKVAALAVVVPGRRINWPTQPAVAEALDLDDLTGRQIRNVQGPRKWAGILEDAEAILTAR